jgi:hypothetical protein
MLQTYEVSFFKKLVDSTGHPVDAWQGCVAVQAPGRDEAVERARRDFAALKDAAAWSLRADYERVALVPASTADYCGSLAFRPG